MTFNHTPGLGIISSDLCVWAGNLRPADEPWVIVPDRATVTIVEKTHIMEPVSACDDLVCRINRWVEANPILAWGGLAAGFLLLKK